MKFTNIKYHFFFFYLVLKKLTKKITFFSFLHSFMLFDVSFCFRFSGDSWMLCAIDIYSTEENRGVARPLFGSF
uniref:Uncharacterized protein n=1 Tax=Anguilla anguilla TaxID=7936 RepID=A0A0E9WPA7_ANGAN